jgi:hypothetical protein
VLYDIHDHDDGAELLVSAAATLTMPSGPVPAASPLAAPLAWLDEAGLSGAVVPGHSPSSGSYGFHFRNGYGAVVTVRGHDFSVSLQGDWLPGQDREEVFGMNREEVTTFLRSVEALPAPDVTDLGEF